MCDGIRHKKEIDMLLKIIFIVIIIIALAAIFVMSMVKSSSLAEYYLKDFILMIYSERNHVMKNLNNNKKLNKKLIRKAVVTIALCIVMFISFRNSLHLPMVAVHIIRIASVAGLMYILASFKMD